MIDNVKPFHCTLEEAAVLREMISDYREWKHRLPIADALSIIPKRGVYLDNTWEPVDISKVPPAAPGQGAKL